MQMGRAEEAVQFLPRFMKGAPALDEWGKARLNECQAWIEEKRGA